MNIYKYIESKAIAKYFKKRNKKLNILNCAELITENLELSIEDKNNAYQELIDNMDDMVLKPQLDYNYASVKEYLSKLICEQNKLLELLNGGQHEFCVTFHYFGNGNSIRTKWTETYKAFDYQSIINEEIQKQPENLDFIVLYNKELNFSGLVNKNGKLVKVDYEILNNLLSFFDINRFTPILPFKKGDILFNSSIEVDNPKPFVFTDIKWDMSGFCYYGYCLDKDLYHDTVFEIDVWHLDYYTADESVAQFQYLKALSLFVQEKISESELSKIRDFARIKIKQDEMITKLDFNDNTREILYNLMG